MILFYARDGQPIDLTSWTGLMEQPDYYRVAETWIDDGVRVSTVWLGIDHNFHGFGPPLIFETMLFAAHLDLDGETWRCSTETEARAMHEVALRYLNDALARGWR